MSCFSFVHVLKFLPTFRQQIYDDIVALFLSLRGEDDIQVKADSTPEPAATPEPAPAPQQAPVVAQAAVVTAAAVSAAQDRHGGHANDSFDDDEGIFDR